MNIEAASDRVTAAWIARQAGVGRAAVANWRKRYPDFPGPVAGGPTTPLFSWVAVQQWLVNTGKADQLASAGRTATGTQQIGTAVRSGDQPDRSLAKLSPGELLARVLVALLPRLNDVDPVDQDAEALVVLDPACEDACLLSTVGERFGDHVRLAGQAPDEAVSEAVRRTLQQEHAEVRVGDALRVDRFADSRGLAWGVLCVPPAGTRQWPALELAADSRWRFGLPDPADAELAWVQHCVAHLRTRGVAVVAMSPASGARPSGRHVRTQLVRSGVLRDVISLPAGLTRTGDGALHVWVLQRGVAADSVRMVDLTGIADEADVPTAHAGWEALFAADDPSVLREVPRVELLDGDTSVVPARYVRVRTDAVSADLRRVCGRLRGLYTDLGRVLPAPTDSPPAGQWPLVTLAELERSRAITILPRNATPKAGDVLFRLMGQDPVVADGSPDDERGVAQVVAIDTDRLDPHFVAMFVRADALASAVGAIVTSVTRDGVRSCRIPRMPLPEQRRYGEAFRRLLEVKAVADGLAAATDAVIGQTVHGLTTGALTPATFGAGGTTGNESPENEMRTS